MIQVIDYEIKGFGKYRFEIRTGKDRRIGHNDDPEIWPIGLQSHDFFPLIDHLLIPDILEKAALSPLPNPEDLT